MRGAHSACLLDDEVRAAGSRPVKTARPGSRITSGQNECREVTNFAVRSHAVQAAMALPLRQCWPLGSGLDPRPRPMAWAGALTPHRPVGRPRLLLEAHHRATDELSRTLPPRSIHFAPPAASSSTTAAALPSTHHPRPARHHHRPRRELPLATPCSLAHLTIPFTPGPRPKMV